MKPIYLVIIFTVLIIVLFLLKKENFRVSNDVIDYLAKSEVEGQENVPDIFAMKPDILCVRIDKNGAISALRKPDNGRSDTVIKYIEKTLKKYPDYDIQGVFCIGLQDAYDNAPPGVMVFSKKTGSPGVLIPDLYAMDNYTGDLEEKDEIPFEEKKDLGLFIGASTGLTNPLVNERLRACKVSKEYPEHLESYLTGICQMKEEDVAKYYPDYKSYLHHGMNKQEQYKYRYLINIDGNTCAWNRLPWVMNSNSVVIRVMSNNLCWYYPILNQINPYITCSTPEELPKAIEIARQMTPEEVKLMQKAGKRFVEDYLNPDVQMRYFADVLKAKSNKGNLSK